MQVFLIGTAHVSRNSAEEVRELIRVVRPTAVMVELCESRARRLRSVQDVCLTCPVNRRSLSHLAEPFAT